MDNESSGGQFGTDGSPKAPSRRLRPSNASRSGASGTAKFIEEFVREYEQFTGLLCEAARDGCGTRCEQEYVRARRWFIGHYYRIAPRLRPYLSTIQIDVSGSKGNAVVVDYSGQERRLDSLERMYLPSTLKALLDQDGGSLIPTIAAVSEAVYKCVDEWESAE